MNVRAKSSKRASSRVASRGARSVQKDTGAMPSPLLCNLLGEEMKSEATCSPLSNRVLSALCVWRLESRDAPRLVGRLASASARPRKSVLKAAASTAVRGNCQSGRCAHGKRLPRRVPTFVPASFFSLLPLTNRAAETERLRSHRPSPSQSTTRAWDTVPEQPQSSCMALIARARLACPESSPTTRRSRSAASRRLAEQRPSPA